MSLVILRTLVEETREPSRWAEKIPLIAGDVDEHGKSPEALILGFRCELHAIRTHVCVLRVKVINMKKETDTASELVTNRWLLVWPIGPGEENSGGCVGRANDYPSFGSAVAGERGFVFDEVESENVDEESNRLVVLVDDDGQQVDVQRPWPECLLGSCLQEAHTFGEAALGAGCGVLVHRALGDGPIDALDRKNELLVSVVCASLGCLENGTGARAEFSTNCAVAKVALLRLAVALDLALDICHGDVFLNLFDPSLGSANQRSRHLGGSNRDRCFAHPDELHGTREKARYRLPGHGPVAHSEYLDHRAYRSR